MKKLFTSKLITSIICIASIICCSGCEKITNDLIDAGLEEINSNLNKIYSETTITNDPASIIETTKELLPNLSKESNDELNTNLILYASSESESDPNEPYMILNNNQPSFANYEITTDEFEKYSELDSLERCGVAYANISPYTMPDEEREAIGSVKPTGWHTIKYDCVNGKYLYNRCHLIGFQLAGENANKLNLVTGTRYLNVDGMLPFENEVADYVHKTKNHVLYRVTPLFIGNELVCRGVQIEAYSVEDNGKGVCYNVFIYNVQPSIKINYENGDSELIK